MNPYQTRAFDNNLGNSIMPLGDFPIDEKEEKEEASSGNASKTNSKPKN